MSNVSAKPAVGKMSDMDSSVECNILNDLFSFYTLTESARGDYISKYPRIAIVVMRILESMGKLSHQQILDKESIKLLISNKDIKRVNKTTPKAENKITHSIGNFTPQFLNQPLFSEFTNKFFKSNNAAGAANYINTLINYNMAMSIQTGKLTSSYLEERELAMFVDTMFLLDTKNIDTIFSKGMQNEKYPYINKLIKLIERIIVSINKDIDNTNYDLLFSPPVLGWIVAMRENMKHISTFSKFKSISEVIASTATNKGKTTSNTNMQLENLRPMRNKTGENTLGSSAEHELITKLYEEIMILKDLYLSAI
jgi:hypothetical protein